MKTLLLALTLLSASFVAAADRPHIVLVMADDLGRGQTGYYDHPDIKTPHLDEMAANGLRFDRFYAGASNCSPTRATVLTGRTNDRTGVFNHGYPLRLQEKTVARALADAGYATGHFGKWHLNGLRGPGAPILESDSHAPDAFGFQTWLSVTNYFDRNPLLSRQGDFEAFEGDSSEIVVEEALDFIRSEAPSRPTFTVIWYGTPHAPFSASEDDRKPFAHLPEEYQKQYGEILAMDRSIGALRSSLREMNIADNTLVWFCSDNGGLEQFGPETMAGLRGSKNTMYEGGLRVPGIIEWPAKIAEGRVTNFVAGTVDIFPTLAEAAGLPDSVLPVPLDGISLMGAIQGTKTEREQPLGFRHDKRGVWIDGKWKFMTQGGDYALYDLEQDPTETSNLMQTKPEIFARMKAEWEAWNETVEASVAGEDYPDGLDPNQPDRRNWKDDPAYLPLLEELGQRPEYGSWIRGRKGKR